MKVPIHQQLAQNKNKKFNNMLNTGNNIVHGSNLPGLTSNNNVIIPSNNAGSYAPQLDHYKLISSPFILRKSQQQQQAIFEISQKIRVTYCEFTRLLLLPTLSLPLSLGTTSGFCSALRRKQRAPCFSIGRRGTGFLHFVTQFTQGSHPRQSCNARKMQENNYAYNHLNIWALKHVQ